MDVHLVYTGAGMTVNTLSHQRIFIMTIFVLVSYTRSTDSLLILQLGVVHT